MSLPRAKQPPEVQSNAPARDLPIGCDLVLYDGVCALCNGTVRFLLARDQACRFRYAPLQSDFAREVLARHHRDSTALDTMLLVQRYGGPDERVLQKSQAVLELGRLLGPPWAAARVFGILPRALLDFKYDLVARLRYRLFGRYETCPLPKPEHRALFIDS